MGFGMGFGIRMGFEIWDFTIKHKKDNRIAHVNAFSRALEENNIIIQQLS